jgi:HEAT repeat protein
MSLNEALPDLLRALESVVRDPLEVDNRPRVALFAGGDRSTGILPAVDPIAITKALGGFAGNAKVVRALKAIVERWQDDVGASDALCAEAIRSLGRVGDESSVGPLLKLWSRLAVESRHGEVRRAALDALARLGNPKVWADMLKTAETLIADQAETPGPQREAARFFGRIRYGAAVMYLGRLAETNAGNSVGNAAFESLARLATPEADRILKNLSQSPEPVLAQAALTALETLVRNQAMWRMLERS